MQDLLSLGFQEAILLVAAISNPADVLRHAQQEDYIVIDYTYIQLPFGIYSSEPKVQAMWAVKEVAHRVFLDLQRVPSMAACRCSHGCIA